MAKIKCPVCGNEIHTTDTKCLNCGSDKKTIEFELKKKEFISGGKIVADKKKNGIIVAIELSVIILSIALYFILFMPRVVDEVEKHKKVIEEDKCTKDSGNWNDDLNECISIE